MGLLRTYGKIHSHSLCRICRCSQVADISCTFYSPSAVEVVEEEEEEAGESFFVEWFSLGACSVSSVVALDPVRRLRVDSSAGVVNVVPCRFHGNMRNERKSRKSRARAGSLGQEQEVSGEKGNDLNSLLMCYRKLHLEVIFGVPCRQHGSRAADECTE